MTVSADATPTSDRELMLTRIIDAPRDKVFRAWTDPELLKQWFAPLPYTTPFAELDVRPGGANLIVMRDPEGNEFPNRGIYLEVIENERLVYCYEMHLDDRKISVSVATLQLKVNGKQTRLMVTEQGAFLDGYDDAGSRERGTGELLDALGRSLMA